MKPFREKFEPEQYEPVLVALIEELRRSPVRTPKAFDRILRRHPKDGKGSFSKSEIIQGFRRFAGHYGWSDEEPRFLDKIRMKPVRTQSGVAPVTILTRPHPCPGRCVFCPSDVRMPKSYLSMEPGAQRAAQNAFDPFAQTSSRLQALFANGHPVGKTELIILGGTWSFYPESYQRWFIQRAFEAMNQFGRRDWEAEANRSRLRADEFDAGGLSIDGRASTETYNAIVSRHLPSDLEEEASWDALEQAQLDNESADVRCVGLVVETRPDHLDEAELLRIRRLGGTKIQIGIQSLSDEILSENQRGHDVSSTRRAIRLLRSAGFKIHAHWMPNLYRATPEGDIEDFRRLFDDPDFRPDELKVYPCSLIESAELMRHYEAGRWRPYEEDEILSVLTQAIEATPGYCRLTRIIRDIPSHDIVAGNTTSNFRELAEQALAKRGVKSRDIRAREIRSHVPASEHLRLEVERYATSVGEECFLQLLTRDERLAGFLRLSLPDGPSFVEELGRSAVIREVHVYGVVAEVGEIASARAQHSGSGRRLIEAAASLALEAGHDSLAVISAVGTRPYYRRLGFADGRLYQHRALRGASAGTSC